MIKPGQFFETGSMLRGYMGVTKECVSVSGGRVYFRRRFIDSPERQAEVDEAPPEYCLLKSILTITDAAQEMDELREAVSAWRKKIEEATRAIERDMGLQMRQECASIRARYSGIKGGQHGTDN